MDIQRTVLWVVFSMSLLLLWDNWMRHTGQPSMFFPTSTQEAPAANGAPEARSDIPQAATPANPAATAAAVPAGAAPVQSEAIVITTDVIRAEIDTIGGELRRLELLKHHVSDKPSENVVLFDASASRTYLGQTGLIGGPFPNHKSPFAARPGPRTLEAGAKQLQLVMESEQNGVRLVKTYTFERDNYIVDIKHDVIFCKGKIH